MVKKNAEETFEKHFFINRMSTIDPNGPNAYSVSTSKTSKSSKFSIRSNFGNGMNNTVTFNHVDYHYNPNSNDKYAHDIETLDYNYDYHDNHGHDYIDHGDHIHDNHQDLITCDVTHHDDHLLDTANTSNNNHTTLANSMSYDQYPHQQLILDPYAAQYIDNGMLDHCDNYNDVNGEEFNMYNSGMGDHGVQVLSDQQFQDDMF